MAEVPLLRMQFADRAALERELAGNLKHGRAFVADASGLSALDDCVLLLEHPEVPATLQLPAQAVFVMEAGPGRGIGVALKPFNAQVIESLTQFVSSTAPAPTANPEEAEPDGALADGAAADGPEQGEPSEAGAEEDDAGPEDTEATEALADDRQHQASRHERLRKLNLTQQIKLARHGDLNDRTLLERLYGKAVWEPLLHNPKLTLPEVANIARKGSLPRPLIELIVENNAWVQSALVRRALLTNPRVSSEGIMRLLRMTPKHELRAITKTTTYSSQIREAAKKVLEV